MPTIYTLPPEAVFQAGKGIGQVEREREAYTRGVEQTRLAMLQRQRQAQNQRRILSQQPAFGRPTARVSRGRAGGGASFGGGGLGGGTLGPPEGTPTPTDIEREKGRLSNLEQDLKQQRFREEAKKKEGDLLVLKADQEIATTGKLSNSTRQAVVDAGVADRIRAFPRTKAKAEITLQDEDFKDIALEMAKEEMGVQYDPDLKEEFIVTEKEGEFGPIGRLLGKTKKEKKGIDAKTKLKLLSRAATIARQLSRRQSLRRSQRENIQGKIQNEKKRKARIKHINRLRSSLKARSIAADKG
jgi:hypothetical protein